MGVRRNSRTPIRHKFKALSVLDRTRRAQWDLDSLLVIPMDAGINDLDELLNRQRLPIPEMEQFRLQPAEESFACGVVGRASFARHRANQLRLTDPREPAKPAIVGAATGMDDRSAVAAGHRLDGCVQHGVDEVSVRLRPNGPTDDQTVEAINDGREVHLAGWDVELRDSR